MLQKDRHPNFDFFVADIWMWTPKGDRSSMEHPFFSLSKRPDRTIRHYTNNNVTVSIFPSTLGMPTIWDKDVLIYCCSQLVAGMKEGREPHPTIRFQVYDFLVSTNRSTSNNGYHLMKQALNRLRGVTINTNIRSGGKEFSKGFGLLDEWDMVADVSNVTVEVKLSEWFYEAVLHHEVLTLHRDYFRLNGGLERRMYELCRKHCGNQAKWVVGIETLPLPRHMQHPARQRQYHMPTLC